MTTIAPKSIFECCLICSIAKNAIISIAIIQIAPIIEAIVLMILATAEPAVSISVFAELANFEAMFPLSPAAKENKGAMQKLNNQNLSFFITHPFKKSLAYFNKIIKILFFHKKFERVQILREV